MAVRLANLFPEVVQLFPNGTGSAPAATPMAIRFDSAADVLLLSSVPVQSAYTVGLWTKLVVDRNTYSAAWIFFGADENSSYQAIYTDVDGTSFKVWDKAAGAFLNGPNVTIGTWYYMTWGHNSADALNDFFSWKPAGGSFTTVTGNQAGAFTGAKMYFGSDGPAFNDYMEGSLAAAKIYSSRLTQPQAQAESTQLAPITTSGLHAYYPFQSVATMLLDASGNNRTLTNPGSAGSWSQDTGPVL